MPLPGDIVPGRSRNTPAARAQRLDTEAAYKRARRVEDQLNALTERLDRVTAVPPGDAGYDYYHVALTAMNIGGSNEVERVRTMVDFSQWEQGMITCSATSDADGFDLSAEWWDGGAWQALGPILAFPANEDVDTDTGFQAGDWADLDNDALEAGFTRVRIDASTDSAADDIFGLHLILRRPRS